MTPGLDIRSLGIASSVVAVAVCCTLAATAGAAKKGGGVLNVTQPVNLAVPDRAPGATSSYGLLTSTITAGKPFKGRQIRDVNVTVHITGTGTNSVSDLQARLTAPNGATTTLFSTIQPGNVIGPLTLDDETPITLGSFFPPFMPDNPTRELYAPWIGTAEPGQALAIMDGGPVRGNWTLSVRDIFMGETNTLVSWGLKVVAGRRFLTK